MDGALCLARLFVACVVSRADRKSGCVCSRCASAAVAVLSLCRPGYCPSVSLRNEYLPFIDQYAQCMTLWSGDSSSFVYPTASREVIVQSVVGLFGPPANRPKPRTIARGDFAVWR
jgi:hypothetical protein